MDKLVAIFKKYKSIILYIFFGGVTTLVNIGTFFILNKLLLSTTSINEDISVNIANIIALLTSILIAYLTNRKWVFDSKANGGKEIFREIVTFFSCRGLTMLLDMGIMNLFVVVLGYNELLIKILANIIVIILNYVLSKLIIFRNKKNI